MQLLLSHALILLSLILTVWFIILQEPQEKKFGKPYYFEQFSGTKRRKVLRSDTFYYVSLLDTLKLLLTNKEIQNKVTSPHHSSTKLEDFCDGSLFKTHPLI